MANVTDPGRTARALQDPALKETLQRLRRTDNVTNLYYLARVYAYLALVIGTTIGFYHYQRAAGLSWWDLPVTLLAIVLVGAGQHQLAGLAHEAAHHILLRHRYLNDLVSDWLCLFPLFSSTHHYRLQHLAHHQFVNDPDLDPDVAQLRQSGHWLSFPLERGRALLALVKQARPLGLVRFMLTRSRFSSMAQEGNPYARKDGPRPRFAVRLGIAYLLGLVGLLTALTYHGDPLLLAVVPAVCGVAVVMLYLLLPERMYQQVRLRPVIGIRYVSAGRLAFLTLLFTALAWITHVTGEWAALDFLLLWVVPLFTSFSFFMILRQLVQHGNGGRGWLTNTRVFLVHRLIRFSVFPVGQDYHLPHHLFATVPHYRLPELHKALLGYPEYREQAVVVHGYFLPPHPTVLDVLAPDYAPPADVPAHIDDTVLEGETIVPETSGGGHGLRGPKRVQPGGQIRK
jgi:fatty acid desaturase